MEEQILKKALLEVTRKKLCAPRIAVVLGSGLGAWAATLDDAQEIPYGRILGFAPSRIPGHDGLLIAGTKHGIPVWVFKGRVHRYEGYSSQQVVRPVRLAALAGADTVILTNAAGGINPAFRPGAFMAIRDQICFAPSPLTGDNIDKFGVRFPDMTEVYDKKLREDLISESGGTLLSGVYLQVSGPQYETPAEICAYRTLGADAVGMSTAVEAIAARHANLRVTGISCITNTAAGISPGPLSHEDVGRTAAQHRSELFHLLDTAVRIASK